MREEKRLPQNSIGEREREKRDRVLGAKVRERVLRVRNEREKRRLRV